MTTEKAYRVRDKVLGKFWTGEARTLRFNDNGKSWKTLKSMNRDIERYLSFNRRYRGSGSNKPLVFPTTWEIVEMEIKHTEKATHSLDETMEFMALKEQVVADHGYIFGYFMDTMQNKGVLKDIEFIFELKPPEGSYHVDMECIKAARAQLRLLGVKTRTFRESYGLFGMMDRSQAMKARLTLEVKKVVDLAALRTQVQDKFKVQP